MADNSEQLAILGQKLLDQVTATYNPRNDPSLALALHPGQPLADDIVQDGKTNPLRISEWLEDQYDYPLWLKRADASAISATSVGAITAKSAYLAMIPWAQPGVPADDPAFPRIAALIAAARKGIGDNPEALPFACEPSDFAEQPVIGWHIFDEKITTTTTVTSTSTPTSAGSVRIDPRLWKMRVVPDDLVDRLPSVTEDGKRRRMFRAELLRSPRMEMLTRVRDLPPATVPPPVADVAVAAAPAISLMAARAMPATRFTALARAPRAFVRADLSPTAFRPLREFTAIDPVEPAPRLHAVLIDRLATLQIADFAQAPAVEQVTTTGSELHVHFEYCMLAITRDLNGDPWWRADLIAEDDWFVPGMARGAMVPESTDPAYARCLPQSLLVVRNVSFTGTWSAEARASLSNQVSFLGPFLMRPPTTETTAAAATEQVSILGAGIQIIGELCSLLPALPPRDPPPDPLTP